MAQPQRSPRSVVMERMKRIGRIHRYLTGRHRWGQTQTMYDGARWRKRTEDEKIEFNLHAWHELRVELANMSDELVALERLAEREVLRLRQKRATRAAAGTP